MSLRALAAATLAALALAAPAGAGTGLLLGVSDDLLEWTRSPQALLRVEADLGVQATRITLSWQPGETAPARDDRGALQRATLAARAGIRVVVAVYGPAAAAPVDPASQAAYCSYLAAVVRGWPAIHDVVVWNEPNSSRFWSPQGGAPAAYEALLARCWDAVHAVDPAANVIAATAPRGTTGPGRWYRAVGAAYRASGRTLPILDTVGHNAYPVTDAEPPSATHPRGKTIAEGDYAKLLRALRDAFAGTGQPLPGERGVGIWYMEDGFQTRAARRLHRQRERPPRGHAGTAGGAAAAGDRARLLPARGRRVLQLPARRRARPRRLAVGRRLRGRDAEAGLRRLRGRGGGDPQRRGDLPRVGTLSAWKAASTSPSAATRTI